MAGALPGNAPSGFLESLQRSQNPDQPASRVGRPQVGQKRPASAMGAETAAVAKGKEVESVLFRQKKKKTGMGVPGR